MSPGARVQQKSTRRASTLPRLSLMVLAIGYVAILLTYVVEAGVRAWFVGGALVFPVGLAVGGFALVLLMGSLVLFAPPLRTRSNLLLVGGATAASAAVVLAQVLLTPPTTSEEAVMPRSTDSELRALAWNVEQSETSASRLASLVSETDADVAVFSEIYLDEGARDNLSNELARDFQILSAPNIPLVLLVAADRGEYEVTTSDQSGAWTGLVAEPVDPSSMSPRIVAVHVVRMSPLPGRQDLWGFGLDWVASQCGESGTIALGDFNADSVNMPQGRLGQCGVLEASENVGFAPTWPTSLPAPLGGVIDHVMATPDWTSAYGRTLDLEQNSSDHRPVFAVLHPSE